MSANASEFGKVTYITEIIIYYEKPRGRVFADGISTLAE